jgi:hypothetical protein
MKKYFLQISEQTQPIAPIVNSKLQLVGGFVGSTHEIEGSSPEDVLHSLAEHFGISIVIVGPDDYTKRSGAV